MKFTRGMAALAVGAIVSLSGVVVLGTVAEAYGPSANTLGCRLYFGDTGPGISSSNYADTFTLTASPAAPAVGDTVTVTFTGAEGPKNGPSNIKANSQTLTAKFAIVGDQTGSTVTATTSAPYPATLVNGNYGSLNNKLGTYTLTGTYTASTTTTTTLKFQQIKFDDDATKPGFSGSDADTYCTDGNTVAPGVTVAGSVAPATTTGNGQPVPGVDPKAAPVTSSTIITSVGSGSSTSTASPTPTTASPTPTTASPTPTTTPTPTTSSTPAATLPAPVTPVSATVSPYCANAQSIGGIFSYKNWPITTTVTPGSAPPGSNVVVSVSVDASITNGPAPLDANQYKFYAIVTVDGKDYELAGPTNAAAVAPEAQVYKDSELPLVAKGNVAVPSVQNQYPVVIKTLWFENVEDAKFTGTFDTQCNISTQPFKSPKAFTAPIAKFNADAGAPTPTASVEESDDPEVTNNDEDSGGVLAATGPKELLMAGLLGLALLQFGAIFAVRAQRSTPKARH